jgi:hypothetical protein
MDVSGGAAQTPVVGNPRKSNDNQLWWFEAGPAGNPGYFYIRSKLSPDLVVDITGGKITAPPPGLQLWTMNSSAQSAWQLWQYVPFVGQLPIQGYIQSLLAPKHVIDLKGGSGANPTGGTQLIIFPLDTPIGLNQTWVPIPGPQNQYNPLIETIVPWRYIPDVNITSLSG